MAVIRTAPSLLAQVAANRTALRDALGVASSAGQQVSVGTGDGSNLTFNFATSPVDCSLVLVDGLVQAPAGVWTVSVGTGPAGVDQLVFGSGNAPMSGASVEALISI